jgi:hypothetical protein
VATQLSRGAELVRLGRRAEARRVFSALVTANPSNVEARVGLAVAGFSKDRPADAFGRLGPLVRDNPDMASPRLHLALLLTWIGSREKARAEFLQVARAAPDGRLGRLAAAFARTT